MFKNSSRKKIDILTIFIVIACCFCFAQKSEAAILFEDNFDGYSDSPENHGWDIPSAANVENCDSPDGGRCLRFSIQARGTAQYWSNFDPNPSGTFEDGYIAFWAKEEGHEDGTAGGVKWLKLFSADYHNNPSTYANVTFSQTYQTGRFSGINCGPGTSPLNDTQVAYGYEGFVGAGTWRVDTEYTAGNSAGYGTNSAYVCKVNHVSSENNRPGVGPNWEDYWIKIGTITNHSSAFYTGSGWHYYEYYVKHNTDDNLDGEFAVWVDGELKIRVANMRNRNNANSMDWDSASLVNHVEIEAPNMYYIYFDDIKTSDSYIEYVTPQEDTTAPSSPCGLSVS
ncbi:MAG TPA: hypothetical protein PLF30_02305 [Candidatus Moranbacteria bacterium]|mgnify:CR=1 FL=1|jgi:hypothetical protein|nr:hypothetical protein [Candidatus Moranbacteria bacterium]HOF42238.1 hypothetical protein [Candidatus Moranbacteria bacterium]HPX94363.1 hypothetical protein [Candidatus Moranbacteria bacterium]HQB59492.1 hypothetical protein [Candidatus Moranbacteria bacterium]